MMLPKIESVRREQRCGALEAYPVTKFVWFGETVRALGRCSCAMNIVLKIR